MSDSESPILADYVHIFLKEVLSLPLSLINNDYPFFLDDHQGKFSIEVQKFEGFQAL